MKHLTNCANEWSFVLAQQIEFSCEMCYEYIIIYDDDDNADDNDFVWSKQIFDIISFLFLTFIHTEPTYIK